MLTHITFENGTCRHISCVCSDELLAIAWTYHPADERRKDIMRELARRPAPKNPTYKEHYQSFSGGSQQTTSFKKGETCPPSWI